MAALSLALADLGMTGYTMPVLRSMPTRDLIELAALAERRRVALAEEQAMQEARARVQAARRR